MTTSSTSSTTSAVTTSSTKRLSGLISGLDTDTLVKNLSAGIQTKIDKVEQNKQITTWKQENYRTITSALSEFEQKYLSSSASSSSILNSNFFNAPTINNTSSYLSVSGDTKAASNMVITSIQQLAEQAGFTSAHKVSTEALTTGVISDSWNPSTISGGSVTINYGGTDYIVSLDSSSSSGLDTVADVVNNLNTAIAKNETLAGKIQFSTDGSTVSVTKQDSSAKDFYLSAGTSALLTGLGLSKGTTAVSSITGTAADADAFFKNTLASGSTLEFTIDGTVHTLKMSAVSLSPDLTTDQVASAMQSALNTAIASNADLKDVLSATVDSSGNVSFSSSGGTMSITGGSQNMLQGLGLTDQGNGTFSTSGTVVRDNLVKSYLSDTLAGSSLTVNLDGVSKQITFNESEKSSYSTAAGLATYLQDKLDTVYGSNNVTVSESGGELSFVTSSGSYSIFSITSSDTTGVLGQSGALHVYAGETNRINTSRTLGDLGSTLSTPLTTTTGSYGLTVNGVDFTFKNSTTLADMITTINNDVNAGVTISYSQTTDVFTVKADNGGADSSVTISDMAGSNLATALFGTSGTDYTPTTGKDAIMKISFTGDADDAVTVERSSNQFTLDGVSFNLKSTFNNSANASENTQAPVTFTVNNNTDDTYKKISDFITDYNALITSVYKMFTESKPTDATYDPLTDAQEAEMSETQIDKWNAKAKQGLMKGDSILSSLDYSMRRSMTDLVSSVKTALYSVGITTKAYGEDGTLVINEDTLKSALADNPDKVSSLFTSKDGIATRMKSVIDNYIGSSYSSKGILVSKAGTDSTTTDTMTQLINTYNDQIDDLKDDLKDEQDRLYSEFTQMETYLSKMNSYASWFSSSSSSSSS